MTPIPISRAKLVRSLHRRKGRTANRRYLAEGARLLEELSRDAKLVEFVFGMEGAVADLEEWFPGIPCYSLDPGHADLFATDTPQGIGAVVRMPEPVGLSDLGGSRPLLYLDGLADPGNLGTILRSAAWFGMGGVLLSHGSADVYNPKSVRASMGAVFRISVAENITVDMIMDSGRPLIGIDARGTAKLGSAELPRDGIYVIGSEAHGVSPDILRVCGDVLSIVGTTGGGESLNAAVAASIVCYQVYLNNYR